MRVLLVEDDAATRRVLERLITQAGHDLASFADAETAWEWLETELCEIAVLDWVLPGMDGLELCRRLRALEWGERCSVLVVTARETVEDLHQALRAGADDFLAKPIDARLFAIRLTIAERRAHIALERHRSEARYKALLTSMPDLIFLHDAEGRHLDYHQPSGRLLFVPPEEFLGQTPREVLPPEPGERFQRAFEALQASGAPQSFEYHLSFPNGDRHYEARIQHCGEGQMLSLVRDVTERHVLSELTTQLATCTTLTELDKVVGEQSLRLFGWDGHFFAITERRMGRLRSISMVDTIEGERVTFPRHEWRTGEHRPIQMKVLRGESVLVPVRDEQPDIGTGRFGDTERRAESLIYVPIQLGDHVMGILSVQSYASGKYQREDLALLNRFADQIAPALDRIVREMETRQLSELATRLSLCAAEEQIADVVADVTRSMLLWDAHFVGWLRPGEDRLVIMKHFDSIDGEVVEYAGDISAIESLSAAVQEVIAGQSRLLNLAEEEARSLFANHTFGEEDQVSRSMVFVPIRVGERVIGILTVQSYTPDNYEQGDVSLLERVAAILAPRLERVFVEDSLRRSEQRLRQIIDLVPHMIFVKSAEGRFVLANQAMAAFHGCALEDLIGHDEGEFVRNASEIERFRRSDRQVIETDEPIHVPQQGATDRDGKVRLLQTTKIPLRLGEGREPLVLGISIDITERVEAERDRQRLERQFQQAQKLESLGILAGGIAHDFNNLLVGVLGNADLALLDIDPDSPVRENIEQITLSAKRAADLTRQMLAYSGQGKFVIETVDLNTLIHEMGHLLKVSITKSATMRLDLSPEPLHVRGDATQLRQVVMNLIVNSSEAIAEGPGEILVTTRLHDLSAARLEKMEMVNDLAPGPCAMLEVRDTGQGMDEETRSRIYDPFFSTKFTGRGLGLAAVRGIVHGHGGAIEVESAVGRGTTFEVFLPVAPGGAAEHPLPRVEEMAEWSGSGKVLVIDDEESVRLMAKRMLERLGFEPLVASGGAEGVALMREHTGAIVFTLLDMTMPLMDGRQTLRELRAIEPGCRVIMTSGYSEQEIHRQFSPGEISGFLPKPFTSQALRRRIHEALVPSA